jgi:hypothetical protein
MPKPQEYTDTFILTKKLFLIGLRGLQSISNPIERPCNKVTHLMVEGLYQIDFYDIHIVFFWDPLG